MEMDPRAWYVSFCSSEQAERIVHPKTPLDYLLKLRGDYIADNVRYLRQYLHWEEAAGEQWDFEKSFSTAHYDFFLQHVADEDRKRINGNIVYGDVYVSEMNAVALLNKKWGKFVCVNTALSYFLYFMNFALLDFEKDEIPLEIRRNALRIACRIALGSESMDFDMDPRGLIPPVIDQRIREFCFWQLCFVVGHEFSHHLLGHMDTKKLEGKTLYLVGGVPHEEKVFSYPQQQEMDADIGAFNLAKWNPQELDHLLEAALILFGFFRIAEETLDTFHPPLNGIHSHPKAFDRASNVLAKIPHQPFADQFYTDWVEGVEGWAKVLDEDFSLSADQYEFYGSCYLDEPNTKWRGKRLVDREDY